MNTPPGLVAAGLAFWGWQTGSLGLALGMAVLLEGHRLVRRRWDLAQDDFSRVSDFCTLLFAVIVATFMLQEPARAVLGIIRWLPVNYLPLLAAQAYSVQAGVDLQVFLLIVLKRSDPSSRAKPRRLVDLSYPFVALCALSAAAANERGPGYYAGLCALAAWTLWSGRPRAWPAWAWAPAFLAAAGLGGAGHVALHRLQVDLERNLPDWIFAGGESAPEGYRNHTALGHIGKLKLSGRIALRLKSGDGPPPGYLYDGVYNLYQARDWFGRAAGFAPVPSSDGEWRLGGSAPRPRAREMRAVFWPAQGRAALALPAGTFALRLKAAAVESNRYGAVRAGGLGTPAESAALYAGNAPPGPTPEPADLELPKALAARLRGESLRLSLARRSPSEAIAAVTRHFGTGFRYSLYRGGGSTGTGDPVADFLLRSRAGHCEHFATATALLLRAAGVPTRYATGYVVREYSGREKAWLVRDRHAHAWVLAWDGGWRLVDTTPASWPEEEDADASRWEPLLDRLSSLRLALLRLKSAGGPERARKLGWLLLPAGGLLLWRLARRRRLEAQRPQSSAAAGTARPGGDSELYLVLGELDRRGWGRRGWEPVTAWLGRLEAAAQRPFPLETLRRAVRLHEKYRFDPRGLTAAERAALRATAGRALVDVSQAPP